MELKGKNAIITGARSGIGKATLHLFVQNGCNCWAVVHRKDSEFLNTINKWSEYYKVWIKPIYIDLGEENSIKDGVRNILKEHIPIHILVNAAGIVSPNRLFVMTKMEDMRRVMDVNFFSVMELTQLVCRVMLKQHSGNIVNVSSMSAWGEDTSQIEYASSKAAIVIATKKLARELGTAGIRVNAVAPGLIDTKMLGAMKPEAVDNIKKCLALQRKGKPEEIAEVIMFLASDRSQYLTGQTIKVDGGGFTLRKFIANY